MSVTCGVNGESETPEHPMFACHHCGMPVCEQHGWVVTADGAFADEGDATTKVPRAAMHCPGCAAEFHHNRAGRHHGWTDTRSWWPRIASVRT